MRIAYFSDNFYPELSGIADTITITGKELRTRGHEVCYVAPHYSPSDYAVAKRVPPLKKEDDTIEGIPVVRLPSLPLPFSPTGQSRLALPFGKSARFLKKFKPDLIHTQSPYSLGWEALRAARHLRIPLVGTNHTAVEDFFPMGELMRRYDAWYYNHCQFVTTPYHMLIERMRQKGFNKPAQALPNPAELSAFAPLDALEKEKLKRTLGLAGLTVLYTGRLGVEKRVDVVLRACAPLLRDSPTLTLVLTGHGSAEYKLRGLAQELRVERQVRFTGFLSKPALAEVYRAADVFAFMSTADSQSISLMQAYASGMPAVCARARGLPDYTPPQCGILVEPGDVAGAQAALRRLLDDPALRQRMGQAGIEFAKRFSPSAIAAEWEKIYAEVSQNFRRTDEVKR